jgi:cytochrome c oxidase assembly protein subunit 15
MLINQRSQVVFWLALCALLVFCMVILGGAVRLTGSGLSMVDWRPLIGIIPPISESSWLEVFEAYKQYPEYKLVNQGMLLSEFKFIFYMEYFHRLLGRIIGLVFFIPFILFLYAGGLPLRLKRRLWILLALGACQGLMGWFMVKSGLVSDPHVSQYRLTAHLLLAVIIFALLVRLIFGLIYDNLKSFDQTTARTIFSARTSATWVLLLTLLMITTGGLTAGTRAGFIYNSWPKMGQDWMPEMVWALIPWWKNLFENPMTIQFIHRWLAIVVLFAVLFLSIKVLRRESRRVVCLLAFAGIVVVAAQVILGVTTLLGGVPVALGVAHQGTGLLLVGLVVAVWSAYLPTISHGRSI